MCRAKYLCCGKILESKSRHNFQQCNCPNQAFIDGGGEDYIRMGAVDPSKLVLIDERGNEIVDKQIPIDNAQERITALAEKIGILTTNAKEE